jgi:hypothetical protein
MKKTAAILTVMTGLVMASAAFAADELTPDQNQLTMKVTEAAPALDAPADAMGCRGGQDYGGGMGFAGQGTWQRGMGQGNRMGMMPDYQQGGDFSFGRHQLGGRGGFGMGMERGERNYGHSWVMAITVALSWILMILGIAALVKHLKKDCTFSFSWRRKNATEAK